MNDAHVYEMQVQMWKPNTWGVTAAMEEPTKAVAQDAPSTGADAQKSAETTSASANPKV